MHNTPGHFVKTKLGNAFAQVKGDVLILNTGKVTRTYKMGENGLQTLEIRRNSDKKDVNNFFDVSLSNDWGISGSIPGELADIKAEIDDEDGFTSKHIAVTAEYLYPSLNLSLQYIAWLYPDSDGIRTQVGFKQIHPKKTKSPLVSFGYTEYVPLVSPAQKIRAFGYYNNTQHRNSSETPILREEVIRSTGKVNWANGLVLEYQNGGIILVKESHKCVNQPGVETGDFEIKESGIGLRGFGMKDHDIGPEKYVYAWANWVVLYEGDVQSAVKEYDRQRYPVDLGRDLYIMANTWGSTLNPFDGRYAAREENILLEIKSQSDLGIDVQQIDDGWQGQDYQQWRPAAKAVFPKKASLPKGTEYQIYPGGWNNLRQTAADKGITPGLWAAWQIPLEDLKWNYDNGDFRYYKLDFARLNTKQVLDDFISKIREFVLYTEHAVRINWDVTENAPRIGYYFGREYGNIYLENRKPVRPENVVYIPHLILRDAWHVSKYINLNKFQVTVQNIDQVDTTGSDAYLHSHPYSVAIALMGSPIFFQETHLYSEESRSQVRDLLKIYKEHREEMFKGYVYPIGDEPDNASWTGFQNHNFDSEKGYLLLFRELHNEQESRTINLNFLEEGRQYTFTNLVSNEKWKSKTGQEAEMEFGIPESPGFLYISYK